MSYEDALIKKIEGESSGNDLFDEQVMADWKTLRPKPHWFSEIYGREEVEQDNQYVKDKEQEFSQETREATRLVYGVLEGTELHNWFGQDCMAVPASRYDDIRNGVDVILCFTQEDRPSVKIGVDITVSEDPLILDEKIRASETRLGKGEPAFVKYFSFFKEPKVKGRVELPRLVIGANAKNTNLLFEDFLQVLNKKVKGEKIEKNQLQHGLLKEMQAQLAYFIELAVETFVYKTKSSDEAIVKTLPAQLAKLDADDITTELESQPFLDFIANLESQRENLFQTNSKLANNIFLHLDAFKVIDSLVKEKGSKKESLEPEQDSTIDYLSHPKAKAA